MLLSTTRRNWPESVWYLYRAEEAISRIRIRE